MNNELILIDRLDMIRKLNSQCDLNSNAYLSFSGGKDSTVLHYMLDLALPGNTIPRVFSNTGIEYLEITKFVKDLALKDERFILISPMLPITKTLQKVGYPFKSKQHSHNLSIFYNSGREAKSVQSYLGLRGDKPSMFKCPKVLEYQFDPTTALPFKCSEMCCTELKKKPFKRYEKENNKTVALTGMRRSEGGQRNNLKCVVFNKDKSVHKAHPLAPVDNDFIEWFINEYNIKLSAVYYEPFNFTRTGCKGCPFSQNIGKDLETMRVLMPNEFKQCLTIWEPVYKEYIRLGYRIKKDYYKEVQ